MASVSSLDQDMRRLRMDRYTPQAAAEVRAWIEDTLHERLAPGDLLDSLRDGVVLCKLASLALPAPGVRYKQSDMPFTQRENISNFLAACERAPLSLPSHDRFLTVDLYDAKDPAQVLQCVGAFSRAANAVNPARFPTVIGPKRGSVSPTRKNGGFGDAGGHNRGGSSVSQRGVSPALTGGSDSSKTGDGTYRSPGAPVSSWSKASDEALTMPAWNIHQYGYMGGASQGNQGISFGSRRQITSPGPAVPSLAEKEKLRREKELEAERAHAQAEEERQKSAAEKAAEEQRARVAEEARWEEETRKARERERQKVEEQKRQWAEEERQWKLAEERRLQEEKAAEDARQKAFGTGPGLRGQYLSEYQAQQAQRPSGTDKPRAVSDSEKIKQLERQLEEARERERQYQLERQSQAQASPPPVISSPAAASLAAPKSPQPPRHDSWVEDERKHLQQEWSAHQATASLSTDEAPPPLPGPRPLRPSSTSRNPSTSSTTNPDIASSETPPPLPGPRPLRPSNESRTPSTSTTTNPDTTTSTDTAPPLPGPRPLPTLPSSTSQTQATSPAPPLPGPRPLPSKPSSSSSPSPFARRPASPFTRPPPASTTPPVHDLSQTSAAERAAEDARRVAAQHRTRLGGLAATSLLEREMERERERQREWEVRTMGGSGGG